MNNHRYLVLPILAFYLQVVSLVEGSYFPANHATASASATTLVTSTVRRRWSTTTTPFPAAAFVHSSIIELHGRDRASLRNLYISKFIHQSITNKSSPTRQRSSCITSRFFSNQNKDTIDNTGSTNKGEEENDHDDDECNLQKLYQQVQKEDSEWYYQTFSKLLDVVVDDPLDFSLCEKSATNDIKDEKEIDAENNNHDNVGLEKEMIDDKKDDNNTKINEVLENVPENKNIDSKTIEIEMPPQSNGSETDKSVVMIQSNMQEDEIRKGQILRDEKEEVEDVKEETSFRDGMNGDTISSTNRVQEVEKDNEEPFNEEIQMGKRERSNVIENREKYERGDENDDREDTQRTRMNLPVNKSPESNADYQQTESSRKSPPLLVRLYNTYTGEVVELCSLSTLLNVGFSKKEIIVLRPKVLELIIEDGIQRPKKGLPKRWVRLSKLEGYEGKSEEEEEDEDFDWEVEIVGRKSLGKMMIGQDAPNEKDSEDSMYEVAEKSSQPIQDREPVLKKNDADDGNGVDVSKSISRGNQNASTQTKQSSPSKNEGQIVSESWGPFTSCRLPNSDAEDRGVSNGNNGTTRGKQKRRLVRDEEDSNRRYYDDDVQLPPQKKTRQTIDRPNYDEEDDDIDEQRPPQPQRRKRVDDFDSRSKTPSQQSRANQQQQRRQRLRQRPIDQRRELIIDRGDDDEPPPNKFWMDLPTFRDYLRTEAQLRLKILGPDWKESVLDESRWRYDLYKTWLTMLGEGVGENPLYEYGDRPRRTEERKRSPPPPPRSRGVRETGRSQRQIRQRRRDFEEEGYEDNYGEENRPRQRPKMTLEEQKYRNGEEQNQADRRPRPQSVRGSTWRNFSDLEGSLQSSSERQRSVRQSSREEGDEEEDDAYFDAAEEGLRSRSSRSSRASKTRARREYVEPRSELSYEDDRTTGRRKGASDFDETE